MKKQFRVTRLAGALAVILAASTPAYAQQTSAALAGVVTTEQGEPIAGAEVIIVHTPSGTTSRATTGPDGRYNARGLRVGGPYVVTVTRDGFQGEAQEDVYLRLGDVSSVDVDLASAAAELEAIEVVASSISSVFSPDKMGTGTNLSEEQIDALPSIQRNIQDYVRMDPRISQTDKGRGEISAGGQNTRFNAIRVDGVSTNDPFGLEANNLPTLRQPVSMDAIEAINIDLANYDVTITGATGAVIDAVTKSGTNDFDGSVYYVYRDQDWVRDNENGEPFNGFLDEETYGGTFGGPLVEDRLFFFVNYEKFTRNAPGPSFGPVGSGASNIVDITPEQIAEAQAIARDVWGFDAGSFTVPEGLETTLEEKSIKLDWNINDYHRASLRYSKTEQVDANLPGLGSSSLSLNTYWYNHNKEFENIVGQVFSDWNDNFSTEFKLSQRDYSAVRVPLSDSRTPQISVAFGDVDLSRAPRSPFLNFGTEQFTHINRVETEQLSAYGAGILFVGDHEIKGGFDWEQNDIFNLFGRDLFGSYQFASLDHFRNGQYSTYSSRRPLPGESFESIAADFSYENLGLFIQDTWSVNYNLSLTFGLRMDTPTIDEKPRKNVLIERIFGLDNTVTIDGQELIQPRFGFNYTFDSERMTQVRGGIGLFQGAAANVWIGNSFQNSGFTPQIYGIRVDRMTPEEREAVWAEFPFTADPNNQPIVEGGQQMTVNIMDPDLEQPSVWKANIGFDHELPWGGMVLTAEALFTKVNTGLHYQILGMGAPTAVGPDGRQIFYCNPATASGGGRCNGDDLITDLEDAGQLPPEFEGITGWANDNVILVSPTSKGHGEQFTLSLSRPMTDTGWYWMAAYTYTNSTEVNPLTSSQAHSNWDGRMLLNPNDPIDETSNYEIKDRFIGVLSWQHAFFGDYETKFAMFYEGRSGRPYSYIYQNDANGDFERNDLFYVPAGRGDVLFTGGAEMEEAFFQWLNENPDVGQYAGQVVPRNSARSSWVNTFDVRISQELPGFFREHRSEIWLDILNIGNLINKDWGQINEIGFPFASRVAEMEGIDPATGRYIYSFDADDVFEERLYDNIGQSRWAVQVGFRYEF